MHAIAFYEPGDLSLSGGLPLSVDEPCLLMPRGEDDGVVMTV